jgi:hypothetical protein
MKQNFTVGRRLMKACPAADAAALERLALWALRYAPVVEFDVEACDAQGRLAVPSGPGPRTEDHGLTCRALPAAEMNWPSRIEPCVGARASRRSWQLTRPECSSPFQARRG